MKPLTIIIYIVAFLLIVFMIYLGMNYLYKKNVNYYKNCCLDKYNGILYYNDCISEKCYYGSQLGWECTYRENTTQITLPTKLMECEK